MWRFSQVGFPHLPWALSCAGWFFQVPELGGMFSIDAMGLHCQDLGSLLSLGLLQFEHWEEEEQSQIPRPLSVSKLQLHHCRNLQMSTPATPVFPPSHPFHLLPADYSPPTTTLTISFLFTNVLRLPIPYQWLLHISMPLHVAGANSLHPVTPPL